MKTILVRFYSPADVSCEFENEKTQKEICFKAARYSSEFAALDAYANTMCTWSTLLDDNSNISDIQAFIDEAWERIKDGDYEWLERHFV